MARPVADTHASPFDDDAEQASWRDETRRLVDSELQPHDADIERTGIVPATVAAGLEIGVRSLLPRAAARIRPVARAVAGVELGRADR